MVSGLRLVVWKRPPRAAGAPQRLWSNAAFCKRPRRPLLPPAPWPRPREGIERARGKFSRCSTIGPIGRDMSMARIRIAAAALLLPLLVGAAAPTMHYSQVIVRE